MNSVRSLAVSMLFGVSLAGTGADFTMEQALHYPYAHGPSAAEHADRIAWVRSISGVRNIFVADGSDFEPRMVTANAQDDGEEVTYLTFSPDGAHLVYVVGGDHNGNWPAEGNLAPNAASSPDESVMTIWAAPMQGGAPVKVAPGDAPALSAKGTLAYIKDHQVWTASLDGKGKPERLFFDRGK